MHRLWENLIEPIIDSLGPKTLVEIGSKKGENTRHLLQYCAEHGGVLHSIDPEPEFDFVALKQQYGDHFLFYRELSLSALPKIAGCDFVLIDGDHNWYTVYNELLLIEKATQGKGLFPVVLVHDIGWPYGRRDLYYNPETIPAEYRKPYQKKGVFPGKSDLVDIGGLNHYLNNAEYEGGPQNGVLTAVEDFIKQSGQALNLTIVPGVHGLGILAPRPLLERYPGFAAILSELQMNPLVLRHLHRVERQRIQETISRQKIKSEHALCRQKNNVSAATEPPRQEEAAPLEGDMKQQLQTKDNELISLKTSLEAARALIGLYENSLSWWITAPLRAVHATIIRLKETLHIAIERLRGKRMRRMQPRSEDGTCTIIVPIYNELHYVKMCLESIVRHTDSPYRVCIVDDASDQHTKSYLREFASRYQNFSLIENEDNIGFVASCNRGMASTTSGDILLLNSDVIVTPGWLRKICACAYSDGRIGIVSPMSTGSSHLWIKMNPGDNIFSTAAIIEKMSEKRYPDVVTPEGWCFYIKRKVYEHIGQFDPVYGKGYCEESDYAMRALSNEYRTVCADDTLIFHKRRATFKDERGERYKTNRAIFDTRWSHYYKKVYGDFLSADPLNYIRTKYELSAELHHLRPSDVDKELFSVTMLRDPALDVSITHYKNIVSQHCETTDNTAENSSVVFLLATLRKNGGVLSVTQLVNDLILMGVDARIVVINALVIDEDIFLLTAPIAYRSNEDLIAYFPEATYAVATYWITMYYLVRIVEMHPRLKPYYFIQDYEPDFYCDAEEEWRQKAKDTYALPAGRFAKTNWIIEKVSSLGVHVEKVPPGLDLEIFYPRDTHKKERFIILSMMRPSTRRRGFDIMPDVFSKIADDDKNIEIHAFGSRDEELQPYSLGFRYVNHGVLSPEQLAGVYSDADIYVDFSHFQGFGRTVLEAMACGTCCVITKSGGVSEFAIHGFNCLMSDSGDKESLLENIRRLIQDTPLREALVKNGLETVKKYERAYSSRETWDYIRGLRTNTFPYDFVDFGCKIGGSMKFAMERLGGKRGLGIDIDPEMVKQARESGFDIILEDVTKQELPPNCVRFCVLADFLEHLPDMETVKRAIEIAKNISKEFIYIKGPVFDYDEYLKSLGLKVFWSSWTGHPCRLTTKELIKILESCNLYDYSLKFKIKIENSTNVNIHPLSSPIDQHEYDSNIHPEKPYIKFDRDLYKEFECIVKLNKNLAFLRP